MGRNHHLPGPSIYEDGEEVFFSAALAHVGHPAATAALPVSVGAARPPSGLLVVAR